MNDSNSYGMYLLGLYRAIFSDIALHEPKLHKDCCLDFKRLSALVKTRGLPVLLVDLPAFGKAFDKALSEGHLPITNLPCFSVDRRRGTIPFLLKGMLRYVFHQSGELVSDPDVRCIRWIRQVCYLAKSVKMPCPKLKEYESVQEFIEIDQRIAEPSLDWTSSDPRHVDTSGLHFGDHLLHDDGAETGNCSEPAVAISDYGAAYSTLQRVADVFSAILGRYDPFEWRNRHGPGAVSERGGSAWKYAFPSWSDHLDNVFPYEEFAHANYLHWADAVSAGSVPDSPSGARLLCVPKTYKGPRLIAAEPIAHQWCQQNIHCFLAARVKHTMLYSSIRFSDQGWNGAFALEGSKAGSLATIDLSSASDRISCYLIERFFRKNPTLLKAFMAVRTRWLEQDIDKKQPRVINLRKFSTMGSALTFPVQSIVFLGVAVSASLFAEGRPPTMPNIRAMCRRIRVFGDDIIVPNAHRPHVEELLSALGLKVNIDKTFSRGLFRESCGVDAYAGNIVTPVHVNTVPRWSAPESILASVDLHNHLLLAGYGNAATYVRNTVDSARSNSIAEKALGSGLFGWITFGSPRLDRFKYRWNPNLSQGEFYVAQMKSVHRLTPENDNGMLLQYFTECQSPPVRPGERLGSRMLRGSTRLSRSWVPASSLAG